MRSRPVHIASNNISLAWSQAFLELMDRGVEEITPLVVDVTGLSNSTPIEMDSVRQVLDRHLSCHSKQSCRTVANTIFPQSLWNPGGERAVLFERYLRVLPKLKEDSRNHYGVYFERLIAYGSGKMNQLDHIITTYQRGNHRRSALQAMIFDPVLDHSNQRRRGFPCLQHVMFIPLNSEELAIMGVYATQYLFERAYGNYLGLCNLGRFVAHELGLELTQMHCITGVATLGGVGKRTLSGLKEEVEANICSSKLDQGGIQIGLGGLI